MNRHELKDTFYKKAKHEGYRARSIYKLKEIQDRFHIIKKNDRVLDLGCSPGSFLQYISDIVGDSGIVIGIDILPTPLLNKKNISTFQYDIRTVNMQDIMAERSLSFFDAITCDIAPNLTGIRETDDRNIEDIYIAVRRIIQGSLKKGGNLLLKSFFSEIFKPINTELKTLFKKVTIYKPTASRSKSSEIYLICEDKIQGL